MARHDTHLPDGDESVITLFERDGDRYVPTLFTTGPWRRDAMHGGAPSALIGRVITAAVEDGELVAGVQIDLERPVPIEPLEVVVRRLPQSRRISHLVIELHADSGRVVSARVLLLRGEPVAAVPVPDVAPTPPEQLAPWIWSGGGGGEQPVYHEHVIEHRVAEGGYGLPGRTVAWLRLRASVVAGEAPSGLAELLAVADFGSALSQAMERGSGAGLINVDVNVSLIRAPVGPWFCLEATGRVGHGGIGLAVTHLRDVEGPLGVVTQSQIAHSVPKAR